MKIEDLFDIEYGHSLALNHLRQTDAESGVAFVSRTSKNNGVSAWVQPTKGLDPLPAGLLTVCLRSRNHALSTFVQPRPFYCGYHIYVLNPKRDMDTKEKLWWATCIEANRYRFNFGRQANRTLGQLDIPDVVPDWVNDSTMPEMGEKSRDVAKSEISEFQWAPFKIGELFDLRRGRNVLKRSMKPGPTAYIGASADNNGVTARIDEPADYQGGQITVSSNGSIGEAFYQTEPFIASGDVTILVPKNNLTTATALFICTLIRAEKYRWNYGRKWGVSRMKESVIQLPVTATGAVDWQGMDDAIKSLPIYSLLEVGKAVHETIEVAMVN